MDIQTLYTIEIGDDFIFLGQNNKPLKIGSVVDIHNFQEPVYGKAKVIEVIGKNNYKAVRVQCLKKRAGENMEELIKVFEKYCDEHNDNILSEHHSGREIARKAFWFGVKAIQSVQRTDCPVCVGRGFNVDWNKNRVQCSTCNGTGRLVVFCQSDSE